MSKFEINRNSVFFIINVNAILTLQLSPHVGHFDSKMDAFMATYIPKITYEDLRYYFFVRFLGELRILKSPVEIN